MKTSTTNRHSATSHFAASRKVRGLAIACALLGATVFAQGAAAKCDPQIPRSCAQPERAKPEQRYQAKSLDHSSVSYTHVDKPHSPTLIYAAPKQMVHAPIGPGPRHEGDQAAHGTHGIIFVGGHPTRAIDKAALNPQPIPPGHSALNPQPIPPGHALHKPLPPGAPIEKTHHKKTPHWDVTKNDRV